MTLMTSHHFSIIIQIKHNLFFFGLSTAETLHARSTNHILEPTYLKLELIKISM